ncbi:hypothetical protein [Brevundimonas sp.]|uniref:hypothetical protein n=1 Tax=Brevundimonas sp. TaxID=1871086 RepID=UPI0035B1BAB5
MSLIHRVPILLVRLARSWLPPNLARWGEAAEAELRTTGPTTQSWLFAVAFVGWALREAAGVAAPSRHRAIGLSEDARAMTRPPLFAPRAFAGLCGLAAVILGLIYMAMSDAPPAYLLINAGAAVFGVLAVAFVALALKRGHLGAGPLSLALGVSLLAVSQWGIAADGVTRWVSIGPLAIQPGLIIAPLAAVLFARSPGPWSLMGIAVVAMALAFQPDRGTAGAVAAGMMALALVRPSGLTRLAAVAAAAGFAVTLARPDASPAMPFVDQILFTSFQNPAAGVAVLLGAGLLILPALGTGRDQDTRVVFGAVWVGLIVAAALGNYPTPLVGYGGSAIIGYFLSLIAFPRQDRSLCNVADHDVPRPEGTSGLLLVTTP